MCEIQKTFVLRVKMKFFTPKSNPGLNDNSFYQFMTWKSASFRYSHPLANYLSQGNLWLALGKTWQALNFLTLGFLAISSSCFHLRLSLADDCLGLDDTICSIGSSCFGSSTARNWLSDSKRESRLGGRLANYKKRNKMVPWVMGGDFYRLWYPWYD